MKHVSPYTSSYEPRFCNCPLQMESCLCEYEVGIELLGAENIVKACVYLKIYTEVLMVTFVHKQTCSWLSEDEKELKM